ncbi:MAG TPA: sugar ABC transporter ATP-binding protein [Terriglobia bacterium]|nr:sugar ABC transporter ATP-binding protein [Terriglobia bacterium]
MADIQPVLQIEGLTKRFFGALALKAVDFTLMPGEIHALVGENGAGKSTLIKILAGVYERDGGRILLDGREVDPRQETLPLAFVHQDLALVDDLSVAENIALIAGYPRRNGLIDWREVTRQANRIYDTMKVEPIDPQRLVVTLSAPEKAILGIVRTLARNPRVLVLDEPTAALPEHDAKRLFDAMHQLRAAGTSIIYVSHRLNELFGLADRVTVFRDGRHVHTVAMNETSPEQIVEQMLGRSVDLVRAHRSAKPSTASALLRVTDLKVDRRGPLSFEARAGEILGLVGLRGGGQEAVGRAIFGAKRPDAGRLALEGRDLSLEDGIKERIAAGIVLLPGDRLGESICPGMSLTENLFINPGIRGRSAWRFISPGAEARETALRLDQFDVRPRNAASLIDWLSGGNQQKVCIARWLEAQAKVVILEEPTAGVDIGAKLAIHDMLRQVTRDGSAGQGAAVIVVSSDLDEVSALCDRALILDRGRIAGELQGDELTMDALIARSSMGAGLAPAYHRGPIINEGAEHGQPR